MALDKQGKLSPGNSADPKPVQGTKTTSPKDASHPHHKQALVAQTPVPARRGEDTTRPEHQRASIRYEREEKYYGYKDQDAPLRKAAAVVKQPVKVEEPQPATANTQPGDTDKADRKEDTKTRREGEEEKSREAARGEEKTEDEKRKIDNVRREEERRKREDARKEEEKRRKEREYERREEDRRRKEEGSKKEHGDNLRVEDSKDEEEGREKKGYQDNRGRERRRRGVNNDISLVRGDIDPQIKAKPKAKIKPTPREPKSEENSNYKQAEDRSRSRSKHYEKFDMDDVLREKIATQLRENGIAETRVTSLSAKIAQAVRDDVIDAQHSVQPQVSANLTEAINKHLDPMLYNRQNATDLANAQKPRDTAHLSNLVLLRLGQVHEEVELCKLSVEDPLKSTRKNKNALMPTPREDNDRSQVLYIKDGIEKQRTERDILQDKLRQALLENQNVEDDHLKRQKELEELDAENWRLKRELQETESDKQSLIAKVKEQQAEVDRLESSYQQIRHENEKLKRQVEDLETSNSQMSKELSTLQSERAKLQVLLEQKQKEIIHLRDPDKDMVQQIRALNDEVTLLRTQTRRLNEEKGMLKSRSTKMESTLDESHKQKSKVLTERNNLLRENQELKMRYRKLALANPSKARTLPDIMSGRNGPSNSSSRNPSRNVHHSSEASSRMSPAKEKDEDDYYR